MKSEPVSPSTGVGVLHLFCKPTPLFDAEAIVAAVKSAEEAGCQVVTVAMLGHKCDMAVMAIHANLRELRALQTALQHAGLDVVDSYVSITEVSEYAAQMPDDMKRPRLYPTSYKRGTRPVSRLVARPLGPTRVLASRLRLAVATAGVISGGVPPSVGRDRRPCQRCPGSGIGRWRRAR